MVAWCLALSPQLRLDASCILLTNFTSTALSAQQAICNRPELSMDVLEAKCSDVL